MTNEKDVYEVTTIDTEAVSKFDGKFVPGVIVEMCASLAAGGQTVWEVRRQCQFDNLACPVMTNEGVCSARIERPLFSRKPSHSVVYCGYTDQSKEALGKAGYFGK